ncbi:MAG: glycosyltransferase family 4 protein [Tannerellaceae bacterium]|jgi:glycosyltransferase involved in cell wall biosynthesis|nr:glycosyltransferase family 4 protein [Tannerellaceae bacterium]
MKKKTIYVFGTRGFPGVQGGVEKHCEYLYPELSGKYEIVVFRRKPYLPEKRDAAYAGIRFVDLPSTRIAGFESFIHSFLCTLLCMIKRPSVVHIHNFGPAMFIHLLKLCRLKVVLTYHSVNYRHEKWSAFARCILKISERLATEGADRIIFVNQTLIPLFKDSIQRKSVFIPNGVHPRERTANTGYITTLGLTPGRYILTVGRITQEKGLDYLIDAFLQSHLPGYQLVLAGGIDHSTQYAKNLYRKIQNQPRILTTGYVDGEELRQLYSHARLFVIASYNEGFPLVLLEAMNYRLPILASDIPGNRQLGLKDTDYFEAGNTASLSLRLSEELKKPGQSCRYDLAAYTWEQIATQVNRIYEAILPAGATTLADGCAASGEAASGDTEEVTNLGE